MLEPALQPLAERGLAWLGNSRGLRVGNDRCILLNAGFFHLACSLAALKDVGN